MAAACWRWAISPLPARCSSERLRAKQANREALGEAHRGIDIEAARTNAADRRAAAQIGASYTLGKQQNLFQAADLKTRQLMGAVDADLRAVAATGDRIAMREAFKQRSVELGLDSDRLMTDWLVSNLEDATRRYGIDVGAQIDREKLSQAGAEFKEDLALQWAKLFEQSRQFDTGLGEDKRQFNYNYGLNVARANEEAGQNAFDRWRTTYGF